jgi:outer membrane protein OmpA-like peptidoglycan-associated protein
VPSEESGASFVALFEAFVGAGNVTESFTVTPDTPEPTSFRINVTDKVLFGAGGEAISPEFFPLLDQIVSFLVADPNVTLIVEGHTDTEGSQVQNLALSQRRADAVRVYLEERGVNGFRLDARGRGDTEPVADNNTEVGRQQNRRIELLLVGIQTSTS